MTEAAESTLRLLARIGADTTEARAPGTSSAELMLRCLIDAEFDLAAAIAALQ